ncbi:uncharacterized protein [Montipora capricornis]|uniref:uncharacterized protein n=1 Tax=Montipora capricornis TaxID=246305 RepID=UPI0035F1B511
MVLCMIVGCGSKSGRDKGLYFARVPSVLANQGEEAQELSKERRSRWISAISRDDLTEEILENDRVCEKHFVSGRAAKSWDKYNIDWVPTLLLGHKKATDRAHHTEAAAKRSERAREREVVKKPAFEKRERELELDSLNIDRKPFDRWEFVQNEEKVKFYTGLPSFDILHNVLEHVSPFVAYKSQNLTTFQEFIMTLIKLKLDAPHQDLSYRFNVSLSTVSRIFSAWMVDVRLAQLINWPEREDLWRTMPQCFKYSFGNKTTVIIDCFQVLINRPSNLLARAQTWSSYKHHNTVKVLIGITPQGTISYVSQAWGGRTSDKFLTENCRIFNKLLPGDLVLADRGFTIEESVMFQQAQLAILAFTKGKDQFDPVDIKKTRGIANVRIHVERVIGLLRRKYSILSGILPIDFLISNPNGSQEEATPMIDRIINVSAALVNLCPGIVPFD